MASQNWIKSLEAILHHEGGYVNHPKDPGGETNLGVTKRVYEDFGGTKDMKELTREDVEPPNMAVTSGKPIRASDEVQAACRNSCNNR